MFKPTKTFISFTPVDSPNVSPGGIIAPEAYKETNKPGAAEIKPARRAKVLAIGPGKMVMGAWKEVSVKVGDYIQLMPNAFVVEVTVNGQHIYIVDDEYVAGTFDETDIIARLPEPKKEEKRIQVLS